MNGHVQSRPKTLLPDLADVRAAVQGWLDETETPPYIASLSACRSLRQMIGSFARIATVQAVHQPPSKRREVLVRADQALRQTQIQDRPGLTAHALSRLLARTLLDMMALCESLRDQR